MVSLADPGDGSVRCPVLLNAMSSDRVPPPPAPGDSCSSPRPATVRVRRSPLSRHRQAVLLRPARLRWRGRPRRAHRVAGGLWLRRVGPFDVGQGAESRSPALPSRDKGMLVGEADRRLSADSRAAQLLGAATRRRRPTATPGGARLAGGAASPAWRLAARSQARGFLRVAVRLSRHGAR